MKKYTTKLIAAAIAFPLAYYATPIVETVRNLY